MAESTSEEIRRLRAAREKYEAEARSENAAGLYRDTPKNVDTKESKPIGPGQINPALGGVVGVAINRRNNAVMQEADKQSK